MALAEHEKRELEEIELRLSQEDPKFAAKLTKPSPLAFLSRGAVRALGVLAVYLCGLLAVVAGVSWTSIPLIAFGAVLVVGVFAGLVFQAWRSRR